MVLGARYCSISIGTELKALSNKSGTTFFKTIIAQERHDRKKFSTAENNYSMQFQIFKKLKTNIYKHDLNKMFSEAKK